MIFNANIHILKLKITKIMQNESMKTGSKEHYGYIT